MRNIISSLLTNKPGQVKTYREACTSACQTQEGANALAIELRSKAECLGPQAPHELRALITRQVNVTKNAGQYVRLEHDLFERIPAACSRDKAAAMAALKAAEKDGEIEGKLVVVAQQRIEGFDESAATKRQLCEELSSAAERRLSEAEAALEAARDKEDGEAMARAAAVVVLARKEVAAALDRNSAAILEAASFEELAARAREECNAAQARFADALHRRNVAELKLLELKSDTHMLEALLAHVRWCNARKAVPTYPAPSAVNQAAFFFHKRERAPHWDGKSTGGLLGGFELYGFEGLAAQLEEPNWEAFEVEPIIPASAPEQISE